MAVILDHHFYLLLLSIEEVHSCLDLKFSLKKTGGLPAK